MGWNTVSQSRLVPESWLLVVGLIKVLNTCWGSVCWCRVFKMALRRFALSSFLAASPSMSNVFIVARDWLLGGRCLSVGGQFLLPNKVVCIVCDVI